MENSRGYQVALSRGHPPRLRAQGAPHEETAGAGCRCGRRSRTGRTSRRDSTARRAPRRSPACAPRNRPARAPSASSGWPLLSSGRRPHSVTKKGTLLRRAWSQAGQLVLDQIDVVAVPVLVAGQAVAVVEVQLDSWTQRVVADVFGIERRALRQRREEQLDVRRPTARAGDTTRRPTTPPRSTRRSAASWRGRGGHSMSGSLAIWNHLIHG